MMLVLPNVPGVSARIMVKRDSLSSGKLAVAVVVVVVMVVVVVVV